MNDIELLEGIPFTLISRPAVGVFQLSVRDRDVPEDIEIDDSTIVAPTVQEAVSMMAFNPSVSEKWRALLLKRLDAPQNHLIRYSVKSIIENVACHPRRMDSEYRSVTADDWINSGLGYLLFLFDHKTDNANGVFRALRRVIGGSVRLLGGTDIQDVRAFGAMMIGRIQSFEKEKGIFELWNPTLPQITERINGKIELANLIIARRQIGDLKHALIDISNYAAWLAWHAWPMPRPLYPRNEP